MSMTDLDVAKHLLRDAELTLVVVKNHNVILESKVRGVSGFLEAIGKLGDQFETASVADKVVGRAIALLCLYSGVKAVYADVISRTGKILLEENGIHLEWNTLVERILNAKKTETCPFEQLVAKMNNPAAAYGKLVQACSGIGLKSRRDGFEMGSERERFISQNNDELKRIRERKLLELKARKEMSDKPVHVTDADFDETVKKHPLVLVDFWAEWCGPCRALAPTVEELHKEYTGRVFVGKLNVDENPQTAESFQVFSIPTLIIMKNGKEADRIVGCVPKKHIEAALKKHLES